ncbi:uncharacterized protein APUU_40685S [Aspergillus puulaauensis]|uniref:Uncharacterized protein n=1 Tax=Aspergillus puulaauensis TaxID=1220207 RepID=A0A7R7XMH0_9EURO|nr:uncharacterized protein APUU_40685S [Aspergillus puulaauensis]BCS24241.1 hypothetical protein APUU_40685S [Aspergillus puulaauensis]
MKFISTISILTFLATLTLTTATASAAEDPGIRCESEADCPKDLPVCCGFDPRIQYCLPENTVC